MSNLTDAEKAKKGASAARKEIEAQTKHLKRSGAWGDIASQAGSIFGDTADLSSDSDFAIGQGLQSSGLGLSAYAALGGGPGIAAGVVLGLGSYLFGAKKRSKARKEAENKWRKGLLKYKEQVKGLKRNTEKSEHQIRKAVGAGVEFDLLAQAQQDAQAAERLTQASRGVEATTYKKSREAQSEVAVGEFETLSSRLAEKLDILDEAQVLAEREINAERGMFGGYKTDYADQLTKKLEEFERV